MSMIERIAVTSWHDKIDPAIQLQAIEALESGKVVLLPDLAFPIHADEQRYLSPDIASPSEKNIRYDIRTKKLGGTILPAAEQHGLSAMIDRFANDSRTLVEQLFPHYQNNLSQARTSYRPVEVLGRPSSYRKDDTRLHVDAFPATPTAGKRILRVFTNVNPNGVPRHWRLGEDFPRVVEKFITQLPKPNPLCAKLLSIIKLTRGVRTPYDHYMHHLHNTMKKDTDYQKTAKQEEFFFTPGSTWLVFTDQASHAAMSGQFLLEQTFYLPVKAMLHEERSPLRVLEQAIGESLI